MPRKTFDILVSTGALILVAVLLVAGFMLVWAHNYTQDQVRSQLAEQKITFPPSNSPAVAAAQFAPMRQYGGQQLTTGPQARVYANYFINNHLREIGGGRTYAEVSSAAQANPNDAAAAKTAQTLFQGETLRGLLLTAYAFWHMGTIAGWGAVASFIGAGLLLILAAFGLLHSRRVSESEQLLAKDAPASA